MNYKITLDQYKDNPDASSAVSISEIFFFDKDDWQMLSIVVGLAIRNGSMNEEDVDFITGVFFKEDKEEVWTEIPPMGADHIGVHETHCCVLHGCKYGDWYECPVMRKKIKQAYPCEDCNGGERHELFGKGDSADREHTHYD